MVGPRLQEVKPGHNKEQNATTSNWRSNSQTQESKIFQQVVLDLVIQQCMDQRRRRMEGRIPNQQGIIRTSSDVLQTMQFARNISKNDEQHFSGITL